MSKLHLAKDLETYFQEQVLLTARKQGVEMSPFANSYLAGLLERFSRTSHFLLKHLEASENHDPALNQIPKIGVLWLEGLAKTHNEQMFQMQSLGDFALFTRGFFSEHIRSSMIDLDYYSAIGENAYVRAGQIRESLSAERALNTFFELAESFDAFAEVFSELADQNLLGNDKDLLKLYEKWLATRSQRIARMLAEKGIIAAPPEPKDPRREGASE